MKRFPTKDKNYYFYKFYERFIEKNIDKISKHYCCDLTQKDEFLTEILACSNVFDTREGILPIKFLPQLKSDEHHLWCIAYVGSPFTQCNYFSNRTIKWKDSYWYYKSIIYIIDNYYDTFNNHILETLINNFTELFLYESKKELTLISNFSFREYRHQRCSFVKSLKFESKRNDYRLTELTKEQFRHKFDTYANELRTGNIYKHLLTTYAEDKDY
jgi:anthranilate/para-aminobenzoate synthase component I